MDLRDISEFIRDFIQYAIIFGIIIFISTFIVSFSPVAGNSMTPNLEEGDIILVSKILQKLKLERNDIIVIKTADKKTYIKRVIGLPGEKVDYLNGVLYINDVGYEESFLREGTVTDNFMFEDICPKSKCKDGIIPENMYLVLGDNREDSFDSRDSTLGLVPKKDVKAKALFRIWPINKFGSIY